MTVIRIGWRKAVVWSILIAGALAMVLGLAALDSPIAHLGFKSPFLHSTVDLLEIATGKAWSEFILPGALILIGGGLLAAKRTATGRGFLYVATVQLLAYLASDLSKPQFGRLRPYEALAQGGTDQWFVGGNSFPSGHVAFFAGLVVPIIILIPRSWPLILLPLIVALQRVLSADHYLSDAGAAFVLVGLAARLLLPLSPPPAVRLQGGGGSGRST